jgi:hypothetical protein
MLYPVQYILHIFTVSGLRLNPVSGTCVYTS